MSGDKKQNGFKQGVFSSLSSLNIIKRAEEDRRTLKKNLFSSSRASDRRPTQSPQRSTRSPQKVPTQSPRRVMPAAKTSRTPSPMRPKSDAQEKQEDIKQVKASYEVKIIKLQDTIRNLNLTINKNKRQEQKLNSQVSHYESTYVEEMKNLKTDNANLLEANKRLKIQQKTMASEQEKLGKELGNFKAKIEQCGSAIHELAFTLVESLEGILVGSNMENSFEYQGVQESDERKMAIDQVRSMLVQKLTTWGQSTGSDLDAQIQRVNSWKLNSVKKPTNSYVPLDLRVDSLNNTGDSDEPLPPVPVISYTVDYYDSKHDSQEFAVALYDFEKEAEGDLEFKQGDVIEIVDKDPSGWWMGKIGDETGVFPSNFVQL